MTIIGKLLVVLNLVFGIGIAVGSVAIYSQRPTWFNPIPDSVDKGQYPVSFPQLSAEIDNQAKAGYAASVSWGRQLKTLENAEQTRLDRHVKMFGVTPSGARVGEKKGLIDLAKTGNPAFFQLKEDPNTKLFELGVYVRDDLDLNTLGKPVLGPDQKPLSGAGTLFDTYNKLAKDVTDFSYKIAELRMETKRLAAEVKIADTQVVKQKEIRDNLINEAMYLAAFEVNVVEQREIVIRRRAQLRDRLAIFGLPKN